MIERIEAAVDEMNELFSGLLDISKLDAGAAAVNISDFPVRPVGQVERTFAGAAREKGLSFRACRATPGCAAT